MKNMIFILVMFISLFLSIYYVRQILTDDSTNLKTKKKEIMGAIFSVTGVIIGLIGLIVPIDKNESVEKRTNNDERQKIEQEFSNNEKIDVINNNSGTIIINNNENNNDFSNEHNCKESQISETQQNTQYIISSINFYIEQLQYTISE